MFHLSYSKLSILLCLLCNFCTPKSRITYIEKSQPELSLSESNTRESSIFPNWIKEGAEGYSVVVSVVNNLPKARPIKCRVIRIDGINIKLRFLESASRINKTYCTQKVSKGDTHWFKGECIWETRAEALKYIKNKSWGSF